MVDLPSGTEAESASMMTAKTISVSIARPASEVYAFAALPENLPAWATSFVKSVTRGGEGWRMETFDGDFGLRFTPENGYGVLDHYVTLATGEEIYIPMRVVPNDAGSEIIYTMFRTPGMSDERLARDLAMVETDLGTLKSLLEG